jgi:dTMP kinase
MDSRFIVIEGIDGAGTTTQTARLVRALTDAGRPAHATHEPSKGAMGLHLREILARRVEARARDERQRAALLALLFAADRLDHLGHEIQPKLAAGHWVISDRYDHSSVAYQSTTSGEDDAIAWLRALNRYADRPDLVLVLDVTPEVAAQRRQTRDAARELFEEDSLQRKLAAFYRDIERHFPEDRIVHVDADRDADAVFADVHAAVLSLDG